MSATVRPAPHAGATLAEILDAVPSVRFAAPDPAAAPEPGPAPGSIRASGVTLDSRSVRPGDVYAALPGAHVHGAQFAGQAVAAGAVAILTDPRGAETITRGTPTGPVPPTGGPRALPDTGPIPPPVPDPDLDLVSVPVLVADDPRAVLGPVSAQVYGHPTRGLSLVGITGTNGKTTTAYILDAALRSLGRTTGLIGTIETRVAEQSLRSTHTTPEACDLQGLFAVMNERGADVVTMEVSSHALALHRVDAIEFDVALFTNLSQDHLDFHHTLEDYFAAKAALFTPDKTRLGVVVVDDAWGRRLAAQARTPIITLSTSGTGDTSDASGTGETSGTSDTSGTADRSGAHWFLDGVAGEPDFVLRRAVDAGQPAETLALRSLLPGDHNRINTALAALALLYLGYEADQVTESLKADPGVPGRLERVDLGAGAPGVYVDFAHTPDAITAALRALAPSARAGRGGPLVAVVGAGGDRDAGKRPGMGAAAARGADIVIVTDDNPRTEDPAGIRAAVASGALAAVAGGARSEVLTIEGRPGAIAEALRRAGRGGVVALLGKGHENGQDIAGVIHPYDDRDAARTAWAELGAGVRDEPASPGEPATSDEPATSGEPATPGEPGAGDAPDREEAR